ncbi:MAG: PfkB family carbohydrate kinase [Cypionkella sp.]
MIARVAARNWQGCAFKCGARGPIDPALAPTDLPHFASAAWLVDTTAAGDSFNAGYLAAYLNGASSPDRQLTGHDLAARVVGVRGAIAPRLEID